MRYSLIFTNTFCQCCFQNFLHCTIFRLPIFLDSVLCVPPSFSFNEESIPLYWKRPIIPFLLWFLSPLTFKGLALSVIHSLSFNTDATKYTGILHVAYKYALASSILKIKSCLDSHYCPFSQITIHRTNFWRVVNPFVDLPFTLQSTFY